MLSRLTRQDLCVWKNGDPKSCFNFIMVSEINFSSLFVKCIMHLFWDGDFSI